MYVCAAYTTSLTLSLSHTHTHTHMHTTALTLYHAQILQESLAKPAEGISHRPGKTSLRAYTPGVFN